MAPKPDAEYIKFCVDGHLAGEALTRMQAYFKTLNGSFWARSSSVGPAADKPAKSDNAAAGSAAPRRASAP